MKGLGLARIGKDAQLRETNNGDPVCNLSLAFSYGRKGDDGHKPTQWVDATLWGKRAEALEQYLVKGQLVFVSLKDVHVETYDKNDGGTGTKLVGEVVDIELAGSAPNRDNDGGGRNDRQQQGRGNGNRGNDRGNDRGGRSGNNNQSRGNGGGQRQQRSTGFDDMDDDVPF